MGVASIEWGLRGQRLEVELCGAEERRRWNGLLLRGMGFTVSDIFLLIDRMYYLCFRPSLF